MTSGNNAALVDFYRRQLGVCERAYNAGVLAALYDAICLCVERELPPPPWLMVAMRNTLEKVLIRKFSDGKGRTGNPVARYRADLIHYTRWDTVDSLRDHQKGAWKEYQAFLDDPDVSDDGKTQLMANAPYDAGTTWVDVFQHASEMLRGTPAFGSPDTVKASYLLVKRAFQDPSQAARFYLANHQAMKRLEIEII